MSRGYGTRADARKRLEAQHQAHPDPAVRELLARAYDRGWNDSADYMSPCYDGPDDVPNPYEAS